MQTNDDKTLPPAESTAPPSGNQPRGSFDLRGNRGKRPKPKSFWYILGGLFLFLVIGLIAIWATVFSMISSGSSDIDESKVKADSTLISTSSDDGGMGAYKAAQAKKFREEEERRKQEAEKKPHNDEKAPILEPAQSSAAPAAETPITPAMAAAQRKLGGGVVVKATIQSGDRYAGSSTGGSRNGGAGRSQPPGNVVQDADSLSGALDGSSGSSNRPSLTNLGGTNFAPTKAVLAPNGKYLLRHNTYARCALYTEIITDNPGIIECRLTDPIYSADGSTVIAEAGAPLTGEQRVQTAAGVSNVFTAWTELETTNGVRARLDSLGAGPMGASGTKAWIDNHNFEKYGGAILLTGFQDLLAAAVNTTQSSGSGYTVNNSEQNVENIATKTLDANINMKPTAYILPGTVLTVIVARDVDFSTVFENR